MAEVREVQLYGWLRKRTGRKSIRLAVSSPAEAVQALCANFPNLRAQMAAPGVGFHVFDSGRNIDVDGLTWEGSGTIKFVPAVSGAGSVFNIILGAVLVVVGAVLTYFGQGELGVPLIGAGLGLIAGGIAQLLVPHPKTKDTLDNQSGYSFSGPENVTPQGAPVPLLYGELTVGSVVVSAGISPVPITVGAPVATVPTTISDGVAGSGGGGKDGGGSGGINESPNTLRSQAFAQVVDVISEGPIVGLVSGGQSVFLNETPLQNSDGSFNFTNFQIATRNGTLSQPAVPGFENIANETAVGVKVTTTAPIVRTITSTGIDAIRVTLSTPSLTTTGSSGSIDGSAIEYAIDLQSNGGGFVNIVDNTLTGKTTSKYEFSHRLELGTLQPPYDVRVRRITPDNSSSLVSNDLYFGSYTAIVDAKLRYPNTAYAAISIDSSQFSEIPVRGYHCKGLIIQVPSNYDPVARTYTGNWDGTFKPAWTNNPAWIAYDLLTEVRYGLGTWIKPAMVNKWALYSIAQYCDQLVDNGMGGTEPRFACNVYLQTQAEAFTLLQNLASCFRGIRYWSAGTVGFAQDSPQDPVSIYTQANVIGGKFNYSGTSGRAIHTTANVQWNDPADYYRQKSEYVPDNIGIKRYGILDTQVAAFGCTSRSQAHRAGRWILYTDRFGEVVVFRTGQAGALTAPGAVTMIADPVKSSLMRTGGRVIRADSASVTVDAPVVLVAGHTYKFSVQDPDAGMLSRTFIAQSSGSTAVIPASFTTPPAPMTLWVIADQAAAPWQWRIVKITEPNPGEYEITAVRHSPEKYDLIESNLPIDAILASSLYAVPAQPLNLMITSAVYQVGSTQIPQVILSCDSVRGATAYEWTYRVDTDNKVVVTTPQNVLDLRNAKPGTYSFIVVAISLSGKRSPVATYSKAVTGMPGSPNALTDFALTVSGQNAILSWPAITQVAVKSGGFVEIRQTTAAQPVWSTANYVDRAPGSATSISVPLLSGTYLARTLDVNGQYSDYISLVTYQPGVTGGTLAATLSVSMISTTSSPTGFVTAQPTGGTGPYTYQWMTSGSGGDPIAINSPTAQQTTFSGDASSGTIVASFNCKVTDSVGATVTTGSVLVKINRKGGGAQP